MHLPSAYSHTHTLSLSYTHSVTPNSGVVGPLGSLQVVVRYHPKFAQKPFEECIVLHVKDGPAKKILCRYVLCVCVCACVESVCFFYSLIDIPTPTHTRTHHTLTHTAAASTRPNSFSRRRE
jgi:hypothetical protein